MFSTIQLCNVAWPDSQVSSLTRNHWIVYTR